MLRELFSLDWYGEKLRRYSKKHSRKNLYEFLSEVIAKHCGAREQRILNVGAGGRVQQHLETHGLHFTSIDIAADRKPDLVLDVEDMHAIPDASVDVIFCIEVLEHVRNPHRAVGEMQRVLAPGGVVVASVPFVFGIHDHPHDYYRFTKFGVQHLFRDFEPVCLEARNGYLESVYVLLVRLFNVGTPRQKRASWFAAPLILCIGLLLALMAPLIRNEDATSGYGFVFRKLGDRWPPPSDC